MVDVLVSLMWSLQITIFEGQRGSLNSAFD